MNCAVPCSSSFALEKKQSEILLANATAAQAEKRVFTARGDGVGDTRLLRKPKSFDGISDSWRHFQVHVPQQRQAMDKRLSQAMIESEVLTEPEITNAPCHRETSGSRRSCTACWFGIWEVMTW